MDTLSLILMIIGAINWGLVGIFQFDLVAAICGSSASVPLGEYMCFRQIKSESSIVLMYSEEQGRLYVFETVI